jgi:hypothetical protein
MTTQLPPIYFYISEFCWIPVDLHAILASPEIPLEVFSYGPCSWTLQTYLRLKASGFPCEFVRQLPRKGIVLAHRDCLLDEVQPSSELLLICIQADRDIPHPYAQLHLVQNPTHTHLIRDSYFMPGWIQPGLIPRDPARGDRFETVAFFGAPENLAPPLKDPAWQAQVAALGLQWQVRSRDRWQDYRDVDAIVAIRDFEQCPHTIKPATKLYNAWHAGVPAILGHESAFRAERQSQFDYLEATSLQETIAALQQLRDDPALRQAMVKNGQQRAKETQSEQLAARWQHFLTQVATPAYEQWCAASTLSQSAFLVQRYFASMPQRVQSQGVLHELRHLLKLAQFPQWLRSLRQFKLRPKPLA